MATYDQIKEILGIPKTTLVDWKNTKDYRAILFGAFRNMTPNELEGFVSKSNNRKEKMQYKTVYKTKRYERTDEIHIFKGKKIDSICVLENESLCSAVFDSPVELSCKEEQAMREHCAKLGRSVCANCVGELYKTLDEDEL